MEPEPLKVGTILIHGDFQFPERNGITKLGIWQENDPCYYVPLDIKLEGYAAMQCSCGDLEIPAGTFLKRIRRGDGYSFAKFRVIQDPRV